ncbi:hypothetical protein OE88DRAFT_235149 [Heliocybe sulcata]|uniref:G-protein coupled receptors family 1 profile domain-containing protein n=1 Tax=Heliocybe sulcata TaxID=5364 RepID=A0A5C3N2I8_9AGAM|nr:hypothetical protein OE88DRAFT_235149 [Heliocybe sulcata]
MRDFSIGPAQIVALFMTCIFYGILLVTTGHCLNILLLKKTRNTLGHRIALAATLCMLAIASNDVALGLVHVLDAFAYYTGPGGAEAVLGHVSSWINVVKLGNYMLQTTIGDFLLVYRCYVIHNRRRAVIALPIVLWLMFVVTYSLAIYVTANRHAFGSISSGQTPFLTAAIVATLVQNIVTTGMIVYRLWSHERRNGDILAECSARHRITRLIGIIIESAAFYTIFTLLTLVTFLTNNNADYAVSDCVVQIIGVSFNLIIIRGHGTLSAGWEEYEQTQISSRRTDHIGMTDMRPALSESGHPRKVSEIPGWPEPSISSKVDVHVVE